jgi:hypothetical protein
LRPRRLVPGRSAFHERRRTPQSPARRRPLALPRHRSDYPAKGYCPRACDSSALACVEPSFSTARSLAGHAGYCATRFQDGHFRTRVLLARARLPSRICPEQDKSRVLVRQDRRKQSQGREQGATACASRLVRRNHLGVPSGEPKAAWTPCSEVDEATK